MFRRVIVTVRQQQKTRLRIGLVAPLCPEAPRIALHRRAGSGSVGIVEVGGEDTARAVEPLNHVAALVAGVKDCGVCGRGAAEHEALCAERLDRLDGAAPVHLADRVSAVRALLPVVNTAAILV
jgi:hypothetical protein